MADYEDKIGRQVWGDSWDAPTDPHHGGKLTDDQLARAKDHGFAPGSCFGKCRACGELFTGDKRSWRCLPCAMAERPLAGQSE